MFVKVDDYTGSISIERSATPLPILLSLSIWVIFGKEFNLPEFAWRVLNILEKNFHHKK